MQAGQWQGGPQAGYGASPYPYGYPYPTPHPPPGAPPPRRSRRMLWIILSYVVAFVVLASATFVVTAIVFPMPRLRPIAFPGPSSVDRLEEMLLAPRGAEIDESGPLSAEELAAALDPEYARFHLVGLHADGLRWSAQLSWTGDDGRSKGTLRLAQFRTTEGLHSHFTRLLSTERNSIWAEEASVTEVAGAALFTAESRSGLTVSAVFARGVIAAQIRVTDAPEHVRDDVLTLLLDVNESLPGDPLDWNEPPVVPVDLAAKLLPAPSGARDVSQPEEFGLADLSDIFESTEGGEEYLRSVGFRRGIDTSWSVEGVPIYLALYLFAKTSGAYEYTTNSQHEVRRWDPQSRQQNLSWVTFGTVQQYTVDGAPASVATLYRDNIAIEVVAPGAGTREADLVADLARDQYDHLG